MAASICVIGQVCIPTGWLTERPLRPLFLGSSRFPGEGGLDFQKEVFRVPKSIGHALDHLDAVVNTLKDAGMHVEVSTGKDASGVFAQVASEALQRREAALASMS